MAEVKNSFISSKMNKDLDDRLIPKNEYRDALNIAVSRSEASDVGALESILGNSIVGVEPNNLPGEIIGYFVDDANSRVYYFKTDHTFVGTAPETATCQILVYDSSVNTINIQLEGYWLNFSTKNPVIGVNLVEELLFWTDNRNQPRKINIEKPSSYYFNEDQISVAKFAPVFPVEFINLRDSLIDNYKPELDLLPSTMSDASDPDTVPLGVDEFSDSNLSVTKYRNGDTIVQAQSLNEWNNANSNSVGAFCYYDEYIGNEVTYGVLYNKYAVLDPRGLAPTGFTIPTKAQWDNAIPAVGTSEPFKSTTLWSGATTNTNANGLNVKPGGWRQAASAAQDFREITLSARFWTSDAIATNNSYVYFDNTTSLPTTTNTFPADQGLSVRVIKDSGYNGWNGDPELLKDKFVRFSYRFKFDDNEYSVVAPFSQDVFIPEQEGRFVNDDETKAFVTTVVEFMQNSVNNAVLNIKLPCIDIINNYKIKAIDIIYTESDKQSYQVLETVDVNSNFISNLNNTNIYQYNYQSKQPIKTLPSLETTRVFDKVPVRALAQESSGNRILYSNYVESYTAPTGLDYYAFINDKSPQNFIEYPQHSLKQNRNYQVGIILADKFGRQTDVILSNYDGLLDANGNPQPGSNVYSDYNTLQFNNNILDWRGDNLSVKYLQPIPEGAGGSGYPGAYAQGEYYLVDIQNGIGPAGTGALYPYFRSTSYAYFTANTTSLSTVFTSIAITPQDFNDSNNTFNVYINEGNGWILKENLTDYTAVTTATGVEVTFTSAVTPGYNVKTELLFGPEKRYRYIIGSSTEARPFFSNFSTDYGNVFDVGRKLSGQYIDYTEIVSVSENTYDGSTGNVTGIAIETKEEIDIKYLFSTQPLFGVPEPDPSSDVTNASYSINVNGFYTYKFGVKQQQQDYYNVYLPGIVNGYPIKDSDLEQGETGFITLVSDNINKVPRNLQDVGPLQNQFTSDETMFPRVTNIVKVTTGGFSTVNKQFDPSFSPDSVDLVGTIEDAFPLLTGNEANPIPSLTGEVNPNSIYNFNTKPYVAKISTKKPVGITEDFYLAPAQSQPYPGNLGLAVYETSPFVSQLELFYETSSAQLISDLNNDIQNESQDINGSTFSNVTVSFFESDAIGTTITGNFFPTSGGQIITTASCSILNIYSYNPQTQAIDTNIDYMSRFNLVSVGDGSFNIRTAQGPNDPDGFFAGGPNSALYDVDWRGKFEINLKWTLNGVDTFETVSVQLQNDTPVILYDGLPFTIASTGQPITGIYNNTSNPGTDSPLGLNGSAVTAGVGYDSNGTSAVFNNGWSLKGARYTDNGGNETYWGSYPGYTGGSNAISQFGSIVFQQTAVAAGSGPVEYKQFILAGNFPTYSTVGSYSVYVELTDDLGAVNGTYLSYTVGPVNYTGQVIYAPYGSGTGYKATQSSLMLSTITSNTDKPIWQGQFQNWRNQDIDIYINGGKQNPGVMQVRGCTFNGSGSGTATGSLGTGTQTGAGTARVIDMTASGSSQTSGFNTNFQFVATLNAFNPSQAQKNAGVAPGEKNPTPLTSTGTYDFQSCAAVNTIVEITLNTPTTGYAGVNVTWVPKGTIPTIQNPGQFLQQASTLSPPFFPRGGNPTVFPTIVPSGGFVGP